MIVYVDLPVLVHVAMSENEGQFENVSTFEGPTAKQSALEFVQRMWGADEEGRVNLLSIFSEEEENA